MAAQRLAETGRRTPTAAVREPHEDEALAFDNRNVFRSIFGFRHGFARIGDKLQGFCGPCVLFADRRSIADKRRFSVLHSLGWSVGGKQ
jgi:hypothetical protein